MKTILSIVLILFCNYLNSYSQLNPPSQEHVLQLTVNKVLIAPASPLLELGSEFTMEAWIFPQAFSYCNILCRSLESETGISFALRLTDGGTKIQFVQSLGTWATYVGITASDSIKLNRWTHVAVSLSQDTLKLYINGMLNGSVLSPGAPINSSIPLSIGNGLFADNTPSGECLKGGICQIKIWNRAIDASEIQTQASQYLVGNESGLVAYWPCDEGTGNSVQDLTSNNLDLTMYWNSLHQLSYPRWVHKSILDGGPYFELIEKTMNNDMPGISDGRFIDLDNDGNMDFLATQLFWNPPDSAKLILLKNEGDFNLIERNDLIINRDHRLTMCPRHLLTDDFNNDSLTDLFIADQGRDDITMTGGQSMLLLQNGNGQMEGFTNTKIPDRLAYTHYAASGDIDNDNDIDIYMCNISGNCYIIPEFYINDGSANFTENHSILPQMVYDMEKKFTCSLLFDFDKDGDLDLYLGGHPGTIYPVEGFLNDLILINDGKGNFTNGIITLPDRTGGISTGTVGVSSADFNGDGWPDLVLAIVSSDYLQTWIQLLINNKDGSFSDAPIPQPEAIWPGGWVYSFFPADLNNDGWMDIVVNNSLLESSIYFNIGNGVFNNYSELIPPMSTPWFNMNGMRQYPEDLNNDQKIDFLFANSRETYYIGKNVKVLNLNTPLVSPPVKPTILSPMNFEETSTSPTLSWIAQDSTQFMHIQVAKDSAFNHVIYNNNSVTASSQWRIQLSVIDTLFWRIRGVNNAGSGEWSMIKCFITDNRPLTQASNISFSNVTNTTVDVNWQNGDGANRVVFVSEGSTPISNPSSFTTYIASTDWNVKGTQLVSSGYFCVFNGSSNSLSMNNLAPAKQYHFQVFEYNGISGQENYITTTAQNNPNIVTTLNTGILEITNQDIAVYPNPSNDELYIDCKQLISNITIIDLQGRIINQNEIKTLKAKIDISNLLKGIYILKIQFEDHVVARKIIVE